MTGFTLTINNSFCELSGEIPPETQEAVKQILTYQNDLGAEKALIFGKIRFAKRTGNNRLHFAMAAKLKELEAQEWV